MAKIPTSATAFPDDTSFLPPHEATPVPGFHAYSHRMAVAPGEEVDLRISGDGPVSIDIVKHGRSVTDSTVVGSLPGVTATPRVIHRGSYVHVANAIQLPNEFSVEVWFRALAGAPNAGLLAQSGFGIEIDDNNQVCVRCDGQNQGTLIRSATPSAIKSWHHVTVVRSQRGLEIFIDGITLAEPAALATMTPITGPLLLGAVFNDAGEASGFFTGDIWAPTIYAGAMDALTISERFKSKAQHPAHGLPVLARWEFDAKSGAPYRDSSGNNHHGLPVNVPIRMIPGPRVTHDSDWSTYSPDNDPDFGYAVRFMSDAFVDCRWPVSATWRVPANCPQGQYAARLRDRDGGERHVHFLVRSLKSHAKMACFSTTNTRVAYNFQSFENAKLDYGAYAAHPCYPVLGQILGQRRPAGGGWHRTTVDFELPFYAWLDSQGIPYDLYSEWDLEADPQLLSHYKVAAWAGHSEYWTINQYARFKQFNQRGGNLLIMSGNTAFWRVSVDLAQSIVEVRKHDRRTMPGVTCDPMIHSAHHHQFDNWPGSYMRATGFPEVSLFGTSTAGFTSPPLDGPRSGFSVLEPGHRLFHQPREVNTAGVFADKAVGYETDYAVRAQLERHNAAPLPIYPHADGSPHPKVSDKEFDRGLTVLARGVVQPGGILDYHCNYNDDYKNNGGLWSDIVIWERPGHGLVLAVGSVLSSHVLHEDENFSKFMLNALDAVGTSK
jgi:hypothetical protein